MIEPRLPYNYAILDANNRCVGCKTYSYEVPLANYIPVPYTTNDYINKYYNPSNGCWYHDSGYQNIWEECPSHNV